MNDHDRPRPFEDQNYAEERPAARIKGLATALVVGAVVVYGLMVGGWRVGDWVSGLDRFGAEEEVVEVVPGRQVAIEIPVGSSARGIAGILVDNGIVRSASSFESAVRAREAGSLLKAGRYQLVTGADLDEIVDILVAGPTIETYRLTVVEGRRIDEIIEDMARQTPHSAAELSAALQSGGISSAYLPQSVDGIAAWEGLLFPATYEFYSDAAPEEILQRLADETERRMDRIDWAGALVRGVSPYEALVMASLVESEAGTDVDRPLIASVIYNRLDRNTPLQLDATVLYALGERGRALTLDDLEFDSPYNTYLAGGLPPTPIGAPGFKSLEAVALPAQTEYLYYVLTSEDGSHSFFVEYEDFLAAKQRAQEQGIGL